MEKIKKTMCAVLAVFMVSAVFAFSSCKSDDKSNSGNTVVTFADKADADKTTVEATEAETKVPITQSRTDDEHIPDGNISAESAKDAPQFVLSSDKAEYAAGETGVVTVSLKNAPLTACFDFYVTAEGGVALNEIATATVSAMQIAGNGSGNTCRIMGMIATTIDIDNSKIADITFTVPEDAKSGDVITFSGKSKEYEIGQTASGEKTDSVISKMTDPTLKITVK